MPVSLRAALRLAAVPALLAGILATSRAAEPGRDDPKPGWRSGPVRYIIAADEDKAYKAPKTDEDRAKAIEQFWARRDPTPGTPANEFKDDFYRRLDDANARFREATTPGWESDRGKFLLTAGYPDDRTADTAKETWTYKRALAGEGA